MEFCPKCKCFLIEDPKRKVLVCRKCKFEKPTKGSGSQRFVEVISKPKSELIVKDSDNPKDATLPSTRAECKKCGNMEAYYWMVQTRSADEPSTRFYRCTKCGMTWREYE
ncbi:MAG TPA: transcription factor S [Candidatus Methanomethylicus sp.]|nr:transcription factor S [Candidatus Methanomethylicus sp.]HRU81842.1 transcription factor S [Candidatus Methanomethylicus sp.]